jgi:hypothetical protein
MAPFGTRFLKMLDFSENRSHDYKWRYPIAQQIIDYRKKAIEEINHAPGEIVKETYVDSYGENHCKGRNNAESNREESHN